MRIGILQTGHAPDETRTTMGDYDQMFRELLGGHGFTFDTYAVLDGIFPDGPDAAEGWIHHRLQTRGRMRITPGSRHWRR